MSRGSQLPPSALPHVNTLRRTAMIETQTKLIAMRSHARLARFSAFSSSRPRATFAMTARIRARGPPANPRRPDDRIKYLTNQFGSDAALEQLVASISFSSTETLFPIVRPIIPRLAVATHTSPSQLESSGAPVSGHPDATGENALGEQGGRPVHDVGESTRAGLVRLTRESGTRCRRSDCPTSAFLMG